MYRCLVLTLCSFLVTACSASIQVAPTQTVNTPAAAAWTKTPVATTTSPDVTPTFQAETALKEPAIEPTATETDTPTATATATAKATATRRLATRTFTPTGPANTPLPTHKPASTKTQTPPPLAKGCPYPDRTGGNYNVRDFPHKTSAGGDDQYGGVVTSIDGGTITIQYLDHYGNPVEEPKLPKVFSVGPARILEGEGIENGVMTIHYGEHVPAYTLNDSETWYSMTSNGQDPDGREWVRYRSGCKADLNLGTAIFIYTTPGSSWAKEILFLQ